MRGEYELKRAIVLTVLALLPWGRVQAEQQSETYSPEQIGKGAETFAVYCTQCHGERMSNPEFFNLKTFPADQYKRFVNSVINGKNAMPPWRNVLTPEDIEALWSYVVAGEKGQ